MRFGVIPRGGLGGLPCLVLGDDYETPQEAHDAILNNRGPGTKAVWFDTARSWDVEFMADVNSLINRHPATVDLSMYIERGVLSKLWPRSSDSMWVSVDCTDLMFDCQSLVEMQSKIVECVGPLPVPNEIFISVTEETIEWLLPAHLDLIFSTVMPGEAYIYVAGDNGSCESEKHHKLVAMLLNKCHTEWRLG